MNTHKLTERIEGSTVEFDVTYTDNLDTQLTPQSAVMTVYRDKEATAVQATGAAVIVNDAARCRILHSNVRVADGADVSLLVAEVVTAFADGRQVATVHHIPVLSARSVV